MQRVILVFTSIVVHYLCCQPYNNHHIMSRGRAQLYLPSYWMYCLSVDDLLGASLESTHQSLDFRECTGGGTSLGGAGPTSLTSSYVSSSSSNGVGPVKGGPPTRTCPSMPLTPDMEGDRPSPPRSQSQPSDLTQVSPWTVTH